MILRITTAAVGLLALGGSIGAVNAADSAAVPAVVAPGEASDLPRFEPSAEATAEPSALEIDAAEPAVDEAAEALYEPMAGGIASWYGAELAGNRTASGERFDPSELTAAHRTLPLGSRVRVTYDGRSVVVRINDRGPFHGNRVIDLSRAAAERIGLRRAGSGRVDLALLAS